MPFCPGRTIILHWRLSQSSSQWQCGPKAHVRIASQMTMDELNQRCHFVTYNLRDANLRLTFLIDNIGLSKEIMFEFHMKYVPSCLKAREICILAARACSSRDWGGSVLRSAWPESLVSRFSNATKDRQRQPGVAIRPTSRVPAAENDPYYRRTEAVGLYAFIDTPEWRDSALCWRCLLACPGCGVVSKWNKFSSKSF